MKYLKTTWADAMNSERREHKRYAGFSSPKPGRSTDKIECPFCGSITIVYRWSIAGGGKRCLNCGAIHTNHNTSFRKKEEK